MSIYESEPFLLLNGEKNMTANLAKETAFFQKYGLIRENREQLLADTIHVYPTEYFNPIHWGEKKPNLTERTGSIHWSTASWWYNARVRKLFGSGKMYRCIMSILRFPNRIALMLLGRERYEKTKKKLKSMFNKR